MRIIFPFFILFLFISFCSAVDFGISPGTIKLSIKQNEIVCENFTLIGNEENVFNGEVKWSRENSRNINQYNLPSEELKISAEIPLKIKAGEYQICVSAKNSGNYYGALMYKLDNSSYGIGTWIELEVKENNSIKTILSLTGNVINDTGIEKIFLFTPVLLIIILILLTRKLKQKKTEFN